MEWKKIMTHSGKAHRDDCLSVAIILALHKTIIPVERVTEVTENEIQNKEIVVLDIGGVYDPKTMSFDHHDTADATSTLYQLNKYFKLGLENLPWFEFSVILDSKGPIEAAKSIGLESLPPQQFSPIEGAILKMFETHHQSEKFLQLLMKIGDQILSDARQIMASIERALLAPIYKLRNIGVMVIESDNTFGVREAKGIIEKERPDTTIGACVSYDNRGPGWTLYRFDDIQSIDFRLIECENNVAWVHKNGFIAKTKDRCSIERVLELIKLSIK